MERIRIYPNEPEKYFDPYGEEPDEREEEVRNQLTEKRFNVGEKILLRGMQYCVASESWNEVILRPIYR